MWLLIHVWKVAIVFTAAIKKRARSRGLVVGRKPPSADIKANGSSKSRLIRAFAFLKEWGGVLTLLFAILYTAPKEYLFDRPETHREKQLTASRQVLADGSSMMIERLLNTSKITDPSALDLMNNMYNVKFFNLIYANKSLVDDARRQLRSSELSTMAGLLAFSGLVSEALVYYDAAIEKSKLENIPYANTLRDKALALLRPGKTQSIASAREAFREAIDFYAGLHEPSAGVLLTRFVAELAYAEATVGDWSCGEKLRSDADSAFAILRVRDPSVEPYYAMFVRGFALIRQGPRQPTAGCAYQLPRVDP